jgi:hypothetical protein
VKRILGKVNFKKKRYKKKTKKEIQEKSTKKKHKRKKKKKKNLQRTLNTFKKSKGSYAKALLVANRKTGHLFTCKQLLSSTFFEESRL